MTDRNQACGRLLVGRGGDTYDPVCELIAGHPGPCMSTAAVDQHRLRCTCLASSLERHALDCQLRLIVRTPNHRSMP